MSSRRGCRSGSTGIVASASSSGHQGYGSVRAQAAGPTADSAIHGMPGSKPRMVIEALADTYAHHYANVHRGIYELSEDATARFEGARRDLARERASDVRQFVDLHVHVRALLLLMSAKDAAIGGRDGNADIASTRCVFAISTAASAWPNFKQRRGTGPQPVTHGSETEKSLAPPVRLPRRSFCKIQGDGNVPHHKDPAGGGNWGGNGAFPICIFHELPC
mgnify:CR=1 FL=1